MESNRIEGNARFSVQPTLEEMEAAHAEFQKVLLMFNGDHAKAVEYHNRKHDITAADLRKDADELI